MDSPQGWTVIGGSVTGRSHANSGSACADAHGWAVEPSRLRTCLAVADGVGAAARGAVASALASKVVVDALVEAPNVNDSSVRAAFAAAREAIVSQASADRVDLADFATTLAVGVVTEHVLVVGQIGDTIAVAKRDGVSVTLSPSPQYGGANQTDLLSADDWESRLRLDVVSAVGYEGFALSTDGLRHALFEDIETARPSQPFFDEIFAFAYDNPQSGDEVLARLHDLDDRAGDDLTLVVAVPAPVRRQVRVVNTYRLHRSGRTAAPLN
jgi:hypothetical protein